MLSCFVTTLFIQFDYCKVSSGVIIIFLVFFSPSSCGLGAAS